MRYLLFILFLFALVACSNDSTIPANERYPWQITPTAGGSISIFGVALGESRVKDVINMLGRRQKVALFEDGKGKLSLEIYYSDFTRSGLSGRLVLTVDADESELKQFKERAQGKKQLESGVWSYSLGAADAQAMQGMLISAMTYLPYADLSEEIAMARFGEPTQKIRSHEKAQHWLYPEQGLDMILNEEGKDILQYVPPARFAELVRPLSRP